MSKPQEDLPSAINRVLRERLEQFEIPVEVRKNIATELLNLVGRPERQKSGVTIMTPEASMDADRQRRGETPIGNKPRVI